MKRFTTILVAFVLILCLSFSLSACSTEKDSEASEEDVSLGLKAAKPDTEDSEETFVRPDSWLDENSAEYSKVSVMFDSASKMAEYRQMTSSYLDIKNLSDDDFWDLFALSVDGFHTEEMVDSVGVYHISESEQFPEYLSAFMAEPLKYMDAPSIKTSRYVSKDPGAKEIDIIPLTVSNWVPVLDHIDKNYDGSYYMYIHLTGDVIEGYEEVYVWSAHIVNWSDGAEHLVPFVLDRLSYVETIETPPEPAETSDSAIEITSDSAVDKQ